MTDRPLTRRLAAVLFADIVGFTRLTAADDTVAYRLAAELQATSRRCIPRAGGRVVRFIGDAVLAEFPSSEAAVRAALALHGEFVVTSKEAGVPTTLHSGVHLGELTEAPDGDVFGDAVNLAARLQAEAGAEQLLVSDDVRRQLRGRADLDFTELGSRQLKGVSEPVAIFAVSARSGAAPGASAATSAAAPTAAIRTRPADEPRAPRLIVLPFRVLRPDAETDFLAFSIADAITATLSGLRSLTVRSNVAALRLASDTPDLRHIAQEADVDLVLTGTQLRVGDRIRVTAQLTEAPTGTALWSETQQVMLGDLFQLQDELTQRIVQSLATPLTTRERRIIRQDVPASARAYELYLRANQVAYEQGQWRLARGLYIAALEEDPAYAPAWARLGRAHRLTSKYTEDPAEAREELAAAEAAFQRALALNPELGLAHNLYAQLETERGRARDAVARLLGRARTTGGNAEIFAGLVHALRYCGLLAESLAAHHAARALDPTVLTSVEYTLLAMGRHEEAIVAAGRAPSGNARELALASLGRYDESLQLMHEQVARSEGLARLHNESMITILETRRAGMKVEDRIPAPVDVFLDPEGLYIYARFIGVAGGVEAALELLDRCVDAYACETGLREDPSFHSIRSDSRFDALVQRAATVRAHALTSYLEADGPELVERAAPERVAPAASA